jgi:hypothetical protein
MREHIAGRPGAERDDSRVRYHGRQRGALGGSEKLIDNHSENQAKTDADVSMGDIYPAWERGILVMHRHGFSDGTHGSRKVELHERLNVNNPDIWMD